VHGFLFGRGWVQVGSGDFNSNDDCGLKRLERLLRNLGKISGNEEGEGPTPRLWGQPLYEQQEGRSFSSQKTRRGERKYACAPINRGKRGGKRG